MPVKKCGSGWQYGSSGKCYTGKEAKKKAHIQGYAIQKSQERRGKKVHKDDIQKAVTNILSEILSKSTFHNIHGLQESYNDAWYGAMKHPDYGCFKVALRGKDGYTAAKYAGVTEKVYPDEALPTMELMRKLNNALKIVTEDIVQCPKCGYQNPEPEEFDKMSEAKRNDAIKISLTEAGKYTCSNDVDAHDGDKMPYEFDVGDIDIVTEMAVTTGAIAIHPGYQSSTGPRKQTVPKPTKHAFEPTKLTSGLTKRSLFGPKGPRGPVRQGLNDDVDRIAGSMSEDLI